MIERRKSQRRKQLKRWQRDSVLVTFALSLAALETVFFDARGSVYTFCLGILLSPLVLRIDERKDDDS